MADRLVKEHTNDRGERCLMAACKSEAESVLLEEIPLVCAQVRWRTHDQSHSDTRPVPLEQEVPLREL